MTIVELKDVQIHAYHGLYPGELKIGNSFEINLSVAFQEGEVGFDNLTDTVNYVELYEIIRQRMQQPTHLLEKLCNEMIQDICQKFPFIKQVTISLYKLHPPIENFEGRVGVILQKNFNA
jgi:dihydroneopterin aldolase